MTEELGPIMKKLVILIRWRCNISYIDAEDLAQEAFIRLLSRFESKRSESRPSSPDSTHLLRFLYVTALRIRLNQARKTRRHGEVNLDMDRFIGSEPTVEDVFTHGLKAVTHVLSKQAVIDQCPPEALDVLEASLQGFTGREIAAVKGCSVSYVTIIRKNTILVLIDNLRR